MDTTVAGTILTQLGGRRFVVMTGAKHLTGHPDALSFTLPGTPGYVKDGINYVRVTLTPMDTYTVTFSRVRQGYVKVVDTCEDVYCDTLQQCFTRVTGLDTRL